MSLLVAVPMSTDMGAEHILAGDLDVKVSTETLVIMRSVLVSYVDDALDKGVNPVRISHVMRDFHRICRVVGYPEGERYTA